MPAILKRPEVLAVSLHIDPKKVAHRAAVQATAARENHHGSVAIAQAAVVKAVKQRRDVRDITDLLAQRPRANLLLENGAHPLERGLTRLLAPVGFRGDADYLAQEVGHRGVAAVITLLADLAQQPASGQAQIGDDPLAQIGLE